MKKSFVDNLVSVVIPVYNSERFLVDTIESVLSQTYKNIEIIIVDDCSKDNSFKIINSYMARNGNIKYHRFDENSGPAIARNKALELAKGRYIAFLDSDDIWNEKKIEKQIELMKNNNAAICYTAIEMIDEEGKLIKSKRNVNEIVDYKYILKNTMIACSSVVVDRYLTGDFRMPLIRAGQDYATWLLLMRDGTKAYGINEALVKYRRVRGSISSNKWKSLKKVWNIYTKCENIDPIRATYYSIFFVFNALKKYYG